MGKFIGWSLFFAIDPEVGDLVWYKERERERSDLVGKKLGLMRRKLQL